MLTENDVINAVVGYLPLLNYTVEATCTTIERGTDIVARHTKTKKRLRIEAKGGTSSKNHTERFGKCFNSGQVVSHVSRALYKAAVLLAERPKDNVALALPDDAQHRSRIECIRASLEKLGISVFFVSENAAVRLLSSRTRNSLCH